MKKRVLIIILALISLLSCNKEVEVSPDVPSAFAVVFQDVNPAGQQLSEPPAVDRLYVDVYESDSDVPSTYEFKVKNGQVEDGLDIIFNEGCTYELYFWAQKATGSIYSVNPGSLKEGVDVSYSVAVKANPGELSTSDSYSAVVRFTYPESMPSEVVMHRNVARIDIASYRKSLSEQAVAGIEIAVDGICGKINLNRHSNAGDKSFRFRFDDASNFISHEDYKSDNRVSHIGSLYIPIDGHSDLKVNMTMFDANGVRIGDSGETGVAVDSGKGAVLIYDGTEVVWKGIQADSLPTAVSKDGWIHLTKPGELAALITTGGMKGAKYHISNDMDMSQIPSDVYASVMSSGVFENICVDGGIYADGLVPSDYKMHPSGVARITNLDLPFMSALFSEVKNFEATNMIIENVSIGADSGQTEGTGILIGRSSGNLYLKNIKVSDSEVSALCRVGGLIGAILGGEVSVNDCDLESVAVTTIYKDGVSGQAGGLIGFVGRSVSNDRSQNVEVNLFKCDLKDCKVKAYMQAPELHSGRLVGTVSGYDRNEKLSVVLCTADESTVLVPEGSAKDDEARALSSRYVNKYKSAFSPELPAEYENLLGGQIYHRGLIRFGNYLLEDRLMEFSPRWDGSTVMSPLPADPEFDGDVMAGDGCYMVYSPCDLIGIREITDTPDAIYFGASIDMNGQGEDGVYNVPEYFADSFNVSEDDNLFLPFTRVKLLEGNGKSIYNLGICRQNATKSAFVLNASNATVHRNLDFHSCCVIGTHTQVETNSTAEAAILCASAGGSSYTLENVNTYDCGIFGVQKIGTLIANLSADESFVSDCNVTGSYIENYEVFIDEMFSGSFTYQDYTITASKSFYPHGEVGGLIGFVSGNASIKNCSVNKSTVNCYGLDDVPADITPAVAATLINALGYYHVPGRHVSTFIGDIRTMNAETIRIDKCVVDRNTKCTKRWDKYCYGVLGNHNVYSYIGQCYYVAFLDKIGSLYIDGQRITLADCRKSTVCYEHNQ